MAKIPPQFVKKPAGGKAPAGKPASGGAKATTCPDCGKKVPAGMKKCPSCGKKMG